MRIFTTLTALCVFAPFAAFTQITISLDDLEYQDGEYNKMYGRNTLYVVQGLTGKIGGPHTWNFSNGPTDLDYTFDYILASTTPCSTDFPTATIAEKRTGDGSEAYMFLDFVDDTGRVNFGACQPGELPIPYIFNPPIIDFPETINYIDSWSGDTQFPAQSGGFDLNVEYSFVSFCNAFGTLTLPGGLGDFACLQVNLTEHYKFFWEGILISESYSRSFYWLIEDAGIAVIIVSESSSTPPPEDFPYSNGYNRMYESSKLNTSNEFSINTTAFLEGPYNSHTGLMATSLNPTFIPLNQPFDMPPWNYTGDESVTFIPDVDIVDWVLIELRDAPEASLATKDTKIARQAAFIKKNGAVVGLDGTNSPVFDIPVANNLFLVLWQKNHLGVMSASPLINLNGIYSYNFTTGPNLAHGGPTAQKEVNTDIWALISGDADSDGYVTLLDYSNSWAPLAGYKGYLPSDDNLDGQVDNRDKNEHWLPNLGSESFVPE
jgi:hypothetical protein